MTLKSTGRCHYCHKPARGLFCEPKPGDLQQSCEVRYSLNMERTKERRKAARHKAVYGDWKPRGGTVKEREDSVVLKAYRAGTLFNGYERMKIEKAMQS